MNELSQGSASCAHCGMTYLKSFKLHNPAGGQFAFCCRGCREVYRLWHDLPDPNPPPLRRFFARLLPPIKEERTARCG